MRPEIFGAIVFAAPLALATPVQARTESTVHGGTPVGLPGADSLRFETFGADQGLSSTDVLSIIEDRDGYIWVGTDFGLNRFDGYELTTSARDPADNGAIHADSVRALFDDQHGRLLVGLQGGEGGFDVLDPTTGIVGTYHADPIDRHSLPHHVVTSFLEDADQVLWVGGDGGLARYHPGTDDFTTFRNDPNDPHSLAGGSVLSMIQDAATGLLVLGTQHGGLSVYDRSSGMFTSYTTDPTDPTTISGDTVNHVMQDDRGTIWVSTAAGLDRFDLADGTFTRFQSDDADPTTLSDDWVWEALEDRQGRLWVATADGLDLLDRGTGTFTRITHDPDDPHSIAGNPVRDLYEDSNGGIWIGITGRGISYLPATRPEFATYDTSPRDPGLPPHEEVTALAGDAAGGLWIGTDSGLLHFDGEAFTRDRSDPDDDATLDSDRITAVATDPGGGGLWVGTATGLNYLDLASHTFRRIPNGAGGRKAPSPTTGISSIAPDGAGGCWVVRGGRIAHVDGGGFVDDASGRNSIRHDLGNRLAVVRQDAVPAHPRSIVRHPTRDVFWVAADGGTTELDPTTGAFSAFEIGSANARVSSRQITAFRFTDGGRVWAYVVGPTSGVVEFETETGATIRDLRSPGPAVTPTSMEVDGTGAVWLAVASQGVERIDPRSGESTHFDATDGLNGIRFTLNASAHDTTGRIYVGGRDGLNSIDPTSGPGNTVAPSVVLTGFDLLDHRASPSGADSPLEQPIRRTTAVSLAQGQNAFSVSFSALNYSNARENRFAYKLEGFDRGWNQTDSTHRVATYTNLPPGDYTLRVIASNDDGVWNRDGAVLHITIRSPWWHRTWAQVTFLAFVGLALGVTWIALRRSNRTGVAAAISPAVEPSCCDPGAGGATDDAVTAIETGLDTAADTRVVQHAG